MSYILDALRKADAERDRGNVPGIHAQPSFGGPLPTSAQPAAKPWLWLAGGGLGVGLVAAVAWYLMSPSPTGVVATPAVSAPPPIAAAPAVVAPAPAPMPTPITPAPAAAPPVQAAAPKPAAASIVARKPKPVAPPEPAAATADAKPAATGEKIYALAELPPEIRSQLPAVSIGGSRYSSNAADRILIVNGQVLHEGDPVAPDLVLKQIRSKAALLEFKGYRYTVAF